MDNIKLQLHRKRRSENPLWRAFFTVRDIPRKIYNQLHHVLKKTQPIVVHTMGKVGSTSIHSTLEQNNVTPSLFHMHFIHPDNQDRMKSTLMNISGDTGSQVEEMYPILGYDRFKSKQIRRILKNGKPISFISVTRDPIQRNISYFFEMLQRRSPNIGTDIQQGKETIDGLIQQFLEKEDHDLPLEWFDIETKRMLGIDVYSRPFPKEQGYDIFERGNTRLLILRLESMNQCIEDAFEALFGFRYQLLTERTMSGSNVKDLYIRFQKEIAIPKTILETVYSANYTNHFYTTAEIETMKKKWRVK